MCTGFEIACTMRIFGCLVALRLQCCSDEFKWKQFEMISYRENCSHSNMLLEQMVLLVACCKYIILSINRWCFDRHTQVSDYVVPNSRHIAWFTIFVTNPVVVFVVADSSYGSYLRHLIFTSERSVTQPIRAPNRSNPSARIKFYREETQPLKPPSFYLNR